MLFFVQSSTDVTYTTPQQLKQFFIIVPSKLRLVTLAAFLLWKNHSEVRTYFTWYLTLCCVDGLRLKVSSESALEYQLAACVWQSLCLPVTFLTWFNNFETEETATQKWHISITQGKTCFDKIYHESGPAWATTPCVTTVNTFLPLYACQFSFDVLFLQKSKAAKMIVFLSSRDSVDFHCDLFKESLHAFSSECFC